MKRTVGQRGASSSPLAPHKKATRVTPRAAPSKKDLRKKKSSKKSTARPVNQDLHASGTFDDFTTTMTIVVSSDDDESDDDSTIFGNKLVSFKHDARPKQRPTTAFKSLLARGTGANGIPKGACAAHYKQRLPGDYKPQLADRRRFTQ